MNGRSFQSLIELTPGVVVTASNGADAGQFSVNGQRASSNYWMLDGVSANTGVSTHSPGNGLGGALGSFSVLGGTNSLVSVDAMEEFRVQTSTYAPEFGRTPGARFPLSRVRAPISSMARLSTTCVMTFSTPTIGSTATRITRPSQKPKSAKTTLGDLQRARSSRTKPSSSFPMKVFGCACRQHS